MLFYLLWLILEIVKTRANKDGIANLQRNQLSDFKQQAKLPNGGVYNSMHANAADLIQFILRTYHFAKGREGDGFVFVEIGAGAGSVIAGIKKPNASTHAIHIHAFEARTYLCDHELKRAADHAKTRGFDVHIVNAIVSDEDGVSNVARQKTPGPALVSFSKRQKLVNPSAALTRDNVPLMRFDTYAQRNRITHVHLMHVAVDGQERRALEGAMSAKGVAVDMVMYDCTSAWMRELADHWSLREATAFFNAKGYDHYMMGKERMLLTNAPQFYDPSYDALAQRTCLAIQKDWDSQGAYVRLLRQFNKRFYTTNAYRLKNIKF